MRVTECFPFLSPTVLQSMSRRSDRVDGQGTIKAAQVDIIAIAKSGNGLRRASQKHPPGAHIGEKAAIETSAIVAIRCWMLQSERQRSIDCSGHGPHYRESLDSGMTNTQCVDSGENRFAFPIRISQGGLPTFSSCEVCSTTSLAQICGSEGYRVSSVHT